MRAPGSRRRQAATVVGSLLSALLLLGVTAPGASAHAALLSTTPGDAEILDRPPSEVTLTFGEPVGIGLGSLKVLTATGAPADDGTARRTDGGKVVHIPLRSGLAEGSYVVVWRVVSADSHPVAGAFTFSIGKPSVDAKELLGRGNLTSLEKPSRAPGIALGTSRFLGFSGLLVLLGGALFCLLLWPAGLPRLRPLLLAAAAVELVSAGLGLVLQGPYAAGRGLGDVTNGGLLRAVLDTQYGEATATRIGLAALALGAVALVRRPSRLHAGALVALGLALSATWSAAGHAGVGEWQPLILVSDVGHLLAVSAWVGGLLVLVLGLRRWWTDADSAQLLPGWSRLATWSVLLLVATGTLASFREVGELSALFETTYGRLLVTKVALVGLMLLFALVGRAFVREHYTAPPSAVAPAPTDEDVAGLRRSAGLEAGLAAVVLGVTALLVNTTPAKAAFAPPYSGRSTAGPLTVQVDIYPARKGLNGLHVYTVGAGGRTVDVAEVTGDVVRSDGEKITVQPRHKSLGHYEDLSFVLPAKGTWTIELQIRTTDVESYPTSQTFTVK